MQEDVPKQEGGSRRQSVKSDHEKIEQRASICVKQMREVNEYALALLIGMEDSRVNDEEVKEALI